MTATFDSQLASHMTRVHRASLGFMGNAEEAREVAQDALAKALAARDRYDVSRPFYPWLYRIVKNTCLDALARRRHRAAPGLESERVVAATATQDVILTRARDRVRIARAMDRLAEEQREILNLRHFQDLSYAEIAALLGVPEGTVMSRIYRARRALVRKLEEEA